MKLVVMIPAYKEQKTICSVIKQIPSKIPGIKSIKILAIDDGSTDDTAKTAKRCGALVISHKKNLGLGVSFKDGLNKALKMGADIIVNIDADNQYNPKEIPKLIKPIIQGKADIVLGDRQISSLLHMPTGKKLGNKISTWFIRRLSHLPIRDAQTGFRAFSREAALKMNLLGDYTYTQETIIQAYKKGLKIAQIPVQFRKRSDPSRLISNIWSYAKNAGATILRTYRDYHPLKVFTYLSFIIFLPSLFLASLVLRHYLITGLFTGMLGTALLSGILLVTSVIVFTIGLLADMIKRNRILQEEILYYLKKKSTK